TSGAGHLRPARDDRGRQRRSRRETTPTSVPGRCPRPPSRPAMAGSAGSLLAPGHPGPTLVLAPPTGQAGSAPLFQHAPPRQERPSMAAQVTLTGGCYFWKGATRLAVTH